MSETVENTFTSYLGPDFQRKMMWQLLVEPEFAEKILSNLAVDYFDEPIMKRMFIIIYEFFKEYGKVPNLQNRSIQQAINEFKTPSNKIEEESLFSALQQIELWNERVLNKEMLHDGEIVRKSANMFIKQQEYRKTGEFIIDKTKNGEIKNKHIIAQIEERFQKIAHIGAEEDEGTEVFENIDKVLRKEFRQTIPTGIDVIDTLTGGGLGRGEIGVILTPSGVGKAQPLSSHLLTPNGWIEMGDVKIGDLVIGSDGKSQKVMAVYPQGEREIYRVDFTDNTSVLCDKEHIWSVNTHKQRTDKHKLGGVTYYAPDNSLIQLTVEEMMDDFILRNRNKTTYNYRLPNISPVEFNNIDVDIHPYVMGVLLGDGCLSKNNQPHITTTDEFVVKKISDLYKWTKVVEFDGRKENYLKIYKILLLNSKQHIHKLNLYGKLSHQKHIPFEYLFNSLDNRKHLLQGLIDSHGTVQKNGTIIYSTTSSALAKDVRELVLSLGGTCAIRNKQKQYSKDNQKYYGRESYSITISFPESIGVQPCSLPRKLERIRNRVKYANNKFIKNIEFSHIEKAQCIYVENDDHLYVTDDYVLTHNTTALTKIANTAYECNKNVLQIIFEDTVEQIQRKHFTIWSEVPLSKMDEENKKVKEIVIAKAEKMKGNGRLVIIKMSQENTTMMDVRAWVNRHQKKYGFKFDLVVLDYLDCLDSHKKTPDRTEAELVIIKSFEAMASDLDIPAWTALQTNRGGLNAEIVEAFQTGGSIKRLQKAHFFMSVAKTRDQKEANLATINIIKARFARDGQTFSDCIFDNDKMMIVIEDKRYPFKHTRNLPPGADEEALGRLEGHAEMLSEDKINPNTLIHLAMSDAIGGFESQAIGRANEDSLIGMADKFRSTMNKEESYGITAVEIKEELEKAATGIVINALFELDGTKPIETVTNDVENVNAEGVVSKDDGLMEWSGETFTTNPDVVEPPEVKIEDMKPPETSPPKEKVEEVKLQAGGMTIIHKLSENTDILELDLDNLPLDSEELEGNGKIVRDMLAKMSANQHVMKKKEN